MSYLLIENYDEALLSFEQIKELNNQLGPWENQLFYTGLGNTYQKLGKYKKAQKIYKEGFLLFPESSGIPQKKAICALLQNDTSSAYHFISQYKSALARRNFPELLITAYVGRVYERAGYIEKAEDIWRFTLEERLNEGHNIDTMSGGNHLFWYYEVLGNLLIDNNINIEEGMECIQKALDLSKESETHTDHPKILSGLGYGYFKQGKFVEALQALKQAEEKLSLYDHSLHQRIQEVEQAIADQKI
jgi:tetratricopeptide (TPR) repeat protein